jgi:hypothetical protein
VPCRRRHWNAQFGGGLHLGKRCFGIVDGS